MRDAEVAVVGAGVVGAATALALARRRVSVVLLEAESEPGLAASGTNSGILHTGFDSTPGELETRLILRSAELRDDVMARLGVTVDRCGAELRAREEGHEAALGALASRARENGVTVIGETGVLRVPGEAVTDPVAYTLSLASAGASLGAEVRTGFRVAAIERDGEVFVLREAGGGSVRAGRIVNCAGLYADAISSMAGGEEFEIYPRKGEFVVLDPPFRLERIILPVPEPGTKGVLVFPTLDGKVVAGPTAVDQLDKADWSVRPQGIEEVLAKAVRLLPALEGSQPIASYAGLRPAGRGLNYMIARSRLRPGLINVAAIRSTGLTASLGIAEYVCELAAAGGLALQPARPLPAMALRPGPTPWWRRSAEHRAAA